MPNDVVGRGRPCELCQRVHEVVLEPWPVDAETSRLLALVVPVMNAREGDKHYADGAPGWVTWPNSRSSGAAGPRVRGIQPALMALVRTSGR